MPEFPHLKTGAILQYPATKSLRFQNQVVRFLDGSTQRYRDSASNLHQWRVAIHHLDEAELAAVEQFFIDNQGRLGNFIFFDPWDSQHYANCSFVSDELPLTALGELNGAVSFNIVENAA